MSRRDSYSPRNTAAKHLRLDLQNQQGTKESAEQEALKFQMSPTLEITPTSDTEIHSPSVTPETKKPRRSSILNRKSWLVLDNIIGDKYKSRKDDNLQLPHKKSDTKQKTRPLHINIPNLSENDFDSAVRRSGSVESPRSLRPRSADSLLSPRATSVDSTLSEQWDVYSRYNKGSIGSEEDNSDTCSVRSISSLQIVDEQKPDELEDTLREETLLRKRRNSLTLERGHIITNIDTLRESSKKSDKQTEVKTKEKIENLEIRLEEIDSQMEIIDKNIDVRISPTYNPKKVKTSNTKRNGNIMTKFRLGGKPKTNMENIHSMSIDSLASSNSRDSRDSITGRESPKQRCVSDKDSTDYGEEVLRENTSDYSSLLSGTTQTSGNELSGIQELLLTTHKLENAKLKMSTNATRQVLCPTDKFRSKSLGSMDLKKNKQDINENQSTAESQLIIEVSVAISLICFVRWVAD